MTTYTFQANTNNWGQIERWRDRYIEQGSLLVFIGQDTRDSLYRGAKDFWMCP